MILLDMSKKILPAGLASFTILCGIVLLANKGGMKSERSSADHNGRTKTERVSEKAETPVPSGRWALGKELKKTLDPDEARGLLAELRAKNSDLNLRSQLLSEILIKLCKNGHSLEAFDLIDPGFGNVRSSGLFTFFNAADLPQEKLLQMIGQCNVKGDVSSSLAGLFSRYPPAELETLVTLPGMSKLVTDSKNSGQDVNMNSNLSRSLQLAPFEHNASAIQVTTAAMELNSKGFLKPTDVMIISKYDSPENVFQKWDQLKSLSSDDSQEKSWLREKRDKIIENMITADAPKTMEALTKNESPDQMRDMWAAIGRWNRADAEGAADWYAKNSSGFSSQQQALVAGSFSSEAFQAGEFDGARMWANQIKDPEARAGALKKIEDLLNPGKKESEVKK